MLPYHARHRQSTRPAVTRPSPRPAEPLTHRETRKHENYPALDIFWTIIEIILWVIWIWILIYVFIDIFRSRDLSGWAKALWFLFVLLIPLIGVLVYLIVRGSSMPERRCSRRNCRTANCAATSKRPRVRQPARRTSWPSSLTYATGVSSRPRNSHARRPRSWPERGPQSAD